MPNTKSSQAAGSDTASTLSAPEAGCCGGPAPEDVAACCVRDADAKAAGARGCGCGTPRTEVPAAARPACC
jgi:hypothetical protein